MDPATLLGIPRAPEAPFLFSRTPWFRYRNVTFGPDSVGALLDLIICRAFISLKRRGGPTIECHARWEGGIGPRRISVTK